MHGMHWCHQIQSPFIVFILPHPALPFCFFLFPSLSRSSFGLATRFLSPDGLRLAAAGSRCQSLDSGFLCWHRGLVVLLGSFLDGQLQRRPRISPPPRRGGGLWARSPAWLKRSHWRLWLSFLAAESRLFICLFVYGSDTEELFPLPFLLTLLSFPYLVSIHLLITQACSYGHWPMWLYPLMVITIISNPVIIETLLVKDIRRRSSCAEPRDSCFLEQGWILMGLHSCRSYRMKANGRMSIIIKICFC